MIDHAKWIGFHFSRQRVWFGDVPILAIKAIYSLRLGDDERPIAVDLIMPRGGMPAIVLGTRAELLIEVPSPHGLGQWRSYIRDLMVLDQVEDATMTFRPVSW